MVLNVGGNDVTEFLYVLLERVSFPYRDINLARWYDWSVLEDLKARLCTLAEVGSFGLASLDLKVNPVREMWHSTCTSLLLGSPTNQPRSMGYVLTTRLFSPLWYAILPYTNF